MVLFSIYCWNLVPAMIYGDLLLEFSWNVFITDGYIFLIVSKYSLWYLLYKEINKITKTDELI